MLSRLLCLLALSSLCLCSPLAEFEKHLKKQGHDVDKIHEELKRESEEVEEEFSGKETDKELADLRAAYITQGTNEVETELEMDNDPSEDLFEGDIILTPEQQARVTDRYPNSTLLRLHALTNATQMWTPMGGPVIPYSYADGFPFVYKKLVNESLVFWAARTCITFRPALQTDVNFIEFNHNATQCSSSAGMIGGKQRIDLGPGCFSLSSITHELSHAFGTMHIQSRPDRDDFIIVNTDNIREDMQFQFGKDPFKVGQNGTYGIPYEFGSLMHYKQNDYAIERTRPTITARDSKYQGSMGSPLASFYDVRLINKMYKCTDKCKEKIVCANNGTQDANKCMQCFCPRGWAGRLCNARPHDATVVKLRRNREIELSVDAVRAGFGEKLYIIKAPVGRKINASVTEIEDFKLCKNFRFFDIIPTKDTRINGIRFCGELDPTPIESETNQMLVWMYNGIGGNALKTKISFTLV